MSNSESSSSETVCVEYAVARLDENPVRSMLLSGRRVVVSGDDVLKCKIDGKKYLGEVHEALGSDIIMNERSK